MKDLDIRRIVGVDLDLLEYEMNREELLRHHDKLTSTAKEIMRQKNHDYAGQGGEKPFANFERCEAMGVCSTEQGFLVRVIDKVSRLSTFVSAGELKVENEGYEDAVLDIINYMILFSAFVADKNEKVVEQRPPQYKNPPIHHSV